MVRRRRPRRGRSGDGDRAALARVDRRRSRRHRVPRAVRRTRPEGTVVPVSGDTLRAPGAILVVSCYELGHQPLGLAWPMAFLERAGYAPRALDLALEPLDDTVVRGARLAAIMVPMHTALRLGVPAARRIRRLNPDCHVGFCRLVATPRRAGPLLERAAHR